jgi:hypothetical protein
MEEKRYPIYRFSATWNQDDYKNNGTGFEKMCVHALTEDELNIELDKFKQRIIDKHNGVEFINCECKYVEDETWVLQWFNHFTLNKFDNDNDVITSFEHFVDRKTEFNNKNGHYNNEMNMNNKNPHYCLMGAEDSWRWKVCHCEHCQKGDWTIINH